MTGAETPAVTLADVRAAQERLRGQVVDTPCTASPGLSEALGVDVVLKFENLQFTGSFKDRGSLVKLLSLPDDARRRGVIAMSAGNHAQAVAHHASRLGIPAVIVMPRFTPNVKVERTRALGADVHIHGEGLEEAGAYAQELARDRGLTLIHPYDDPAIIAGQGTVALEMLAEHPDLDVLIVPVGGGGLIAGNAVAARGLRPGLEVIGVQMARYPSMLQALRGEPVDCGPSTIAEGIAVKAPGRLTLPIVRALVREILLVDEGHVERAVLRLLEMEKTVVEGAGAAGVAALSAYRERFRGRTVGVILSGGNIDLPILSSVIERGLVRSGRLVQLKVEIRDVPGALADVTRRIADADGDVVHVGHQRAFTNLPLRSAELDFVVQARGPAHIDQIVHALEAGGYVTRRVEGYAEPGGGTGV